MNAALWIAAALLSLVFLATGIDKLTTPLQTLRAKRTWAKGFDPRFVRLLGALEVFGAIGLIVPSLTGIASGLVPLAAACLAVLMVGALAVEARHHPSAALVLPAATLILAVLVAVGRFGAYPL